MKVVTFVSWLSIVFLSGLLGACSTATPRATTTIDEDIERRVAIDPETFVGKVEGTNAFIAIVSFEGEVEVYICDGTAEAVSISVWLEGTLNNGILEARSADQKVSVTGTQNGDSLVISVKGLGADTRTATATETTRPAGLWTAIGNSDEFLAETASAEDLFRIGWIVLPDGSQRGAANKQTVTVTEPVDTSSGQNGEDSFPATNPEPEPTEDDLGACSTYYRSYHYGKRALAGLDLKEAEIKMVNSYMAMAKRLWKADGCQAAFGNITQGGLTFN
jgi:hypothetical protein